jgi:hypothetical protein
LIPDTCHLYPRTFLTALLATTFDALDLICLHAVIRAASGSLGIYWLPSQHLLCSPQPHGYATLRLEHFRKKQAPVEMAAHIVRLHTAGLSSARDERDATSVASGPMGLLEMNDCLPLLRTDSPAVQSSFRFPTPSWPAFEVPRPL